MGDKTKENALKADDNRQECLDGLAAIHKDEDTCFPALANGTEVNNNNKCVAGRAGLLRHVTQATYPRALGRPGCPEAKPPPTTPRRSYKIDCGVDSTLMLIIGCCVLGGTVRGPHSPAHAAVLKPASARAPHVTAWRGGLIKDGVARVIAGAHHRLLRVQGQERQLGWLGGSRDQGFMARATLAHMYLGRSKVS